MGNHGAVGGISERRRSSCSSLTSVMIWLQPTNTPETIVLHVEAIYKLHCLMQTFKTTVLTYLCGCISHCCN